MKNATSAMKTHLNADCTTLCRLYKITRGDGSVFCFTDHDQNIDTRPYQSYLTDGDPSLGGYVYEAAAGFSPTASQNKSDLSVDNQEATAFIDSVYLKENEIRFGLWDAAVVEVRAVNWADLTMGEIRLRKGTFGNITMSNGMFTTEVLGLSNKLQILLGETYGTSCDAELGDGRCKVVVPYEAGRVCANPSIGLSDSHHVTPYSGLTGQGSLGSGLLTCSTNNTTNGSEGPVTPATGVGTRGTYTLYNCASLNGAQTYVFSVTSGTVPLAGDSITITGFTTSRFNGTFTIGSSVPTSTSGFYADGIITFTSGNNSGLSYQIKSWDGITFTLCSALFVALADSDTFMVSPGCAHNIFDCLQKFNNVANNRSFPTIPGMDSILNYPNAQGV